jgi:hypothetical protein
MPNFPYLSVTQNILMVSVSAVYVQVARTSMYNFPPQTRCSERDAVVIVGEKQRVARQLTDQRPCSIS